MKLDTLLVYVLAACFGGLGWHSGTFVNSAATSAVDLKAAKNSIAALLPYSDVGAAADSTYMDSAPTGSISYQPHETEDYGTMDVNGRAAVYDPGDELLRALNAELASKGKELGVLPEEPDYADTVFNQLEVASKYDMMQKLERDLREEQEIVSKSALLMKLLADPSVDTLPVVYVEDNLPEEPDVNDIYATVPVSQMAKRSRYYRRYPWKRHNRNRSTYEPELRYACTPSKEDVFKLLVNLHENRKGNHSKTVSFCNRKRPAKAIFTNIRFLG